MTPHPAAAVDLLRERRLLFVTGKGGVGKTSIAAAIAELAAANGQRTLVCEMDAKGALAAAYGAGELAFQPREIAPNLFAMTMNTEDALREYIRLFVRVPLIGKITPLARTFDFVADAAPGVKEILAIGKICYEVRERHYDLVVVDAEATGHIVAQIGAPKVIRNLIQVGLVHDQTQWMLNLLQDPDITGIAIVTTPEEMPVNETLGLVERLPTETGVEVTAVIANRVVTSPFDESELSALQACVPPPTALVEAAGARVATVIDAAIISAARARTSAEHLQRLDDGVREIAAGETAAGETAAGEIPIIRVPELNTRATGRRVVTLISEQLADEQPVGEQRTRRPE